MIIEAVVVGGIVCYAMKTKAASNIRNAISDFRQGYQSEVAQTTPIECPNLSDAQACYDFVLRDMVRRATIDDLRSVAELFSKYGPTQS